MLAKTHCRSTSKPTSYQEAFLKVVNVITPAVLLFYPVFHNTSFVRLQCTIYTYDGMCLLGILR